MIGHLQHITLQRRAAVQQRFRCRNLNIPGQQDPSFSRFQHHDQRIIVILVIGHFNRGEHIENSRSNRDAVSCFQPLGFHAPLRCSNSQRMLLFRCVQIHGRRIPGPDRNIAVAQPFEASDMVFVRVRDEYTRKLRYAHVFHGCEDSSPDIRVSCIDQADFPIHTDEQCISFSYMHGKHPDILCLRMTGHHLPTSDQSHQQKQRDPFFHHMMHRSSLQTRLRHDKRIGHAFSSRTGSSVSGTRAFQHRRFSAKKKAVSLPGKHCS